MYYGIKRAKELEFNQMVVCRCPNWCEEGYQIATWNGEEFEYDADPNGRFNETVIAFMPLNANGEPIKL